MASGTPAGLLRRLAALLYDWILLVALFFLLTAGLLAFRGGAAFAPHDPFYLASLLLTGILFFGWFWMHGGQTLGMRAWRLQLVSQSGDRLTWLQLVARCGTAMLAAGCLGLGYLWMLIDGESCCWQDRISGTRVIFRPGMGKGV